MSSTDQNTPAEKPGRRNRKAERRNQKPDRQPEAKEQTGATAAPAETAPIEAAAAADSAPVEEAAPADTAPVSLQTIANAYGDYTRKSLEETRSFVEKLTGVRSLDKAMEVQTEFAKQAYETFVTESQKIRELHSELARQTLKPLEGLVSKPTRDAG